MEIVFIHDPAMGTPCGHYSTVRAADASRTYYDDFGFWVSHASNSRIIDFSECVPSANFDDPNYRDEFVWNSNIGAQACYQTAQCPSPFGQISSMIISGQQLLNGYSVDRDNCRVVFAIDMRLAIQDPFCSACCL